ncbi:diguanylate cyclase (GGDEF)-like protein [Natranaerovirga pectinivora]|uniref:Diguanylate cyclase (GGDEF)-like protein n=1 Tax=Natranaerovirga pectinivora TaxID=682400 RepID=A0A4R3MGA1_9FIRM|nr:diguanylate cyclase [Natranaerovirga pectinivora]TCT12206.1 diguanylate cyclase (GGDEF)-like protein [Natranaerovirga pectinivora]
MSISLRTRFAITFGALIIGLTILLGILIGHKTSYEFRNEIGNALSETAFQMADKLDQYMWSRSGEIEILAELEPLKEGTDMMAVQTLLNQLQKSFPSFSWIGFTDSQGIVRAATNGILVDQDISHRPVYQEGIKGHFIGDVHDAVLLSNLLPNPTGEPMKFVDISLPVFNTAGEYTGVLAAHLSWEWAKEIENSILKPLVNRRQVELFVISDIDDTILLGPSEMIGQSLKLDSINNARLGDNHWNIETWYDNKDYLTGFVQADGYMNYPGLGWVVLVRQPVGIAYASVKSLQNFIFLLGGALSIIFAALGWFIAGRVVEPLQEIADVANRLKVGDKVAIPQHKGIKEIEILESSLSQLIESLTKTESALGEMESLAQHDSLTGLPNRIALNYHLETAIKKAKQSGLTLTFLYVDLDGFKQVNDTLGHYVGDLVLQEVAKRLKMNIRDDEMVIRLGGDEFLMVLYTSLKHPIENATVVSDRIIKDLNEPLNLDGNNVKIGCSIGGAVWPINHTEITEIIVLADEALYVSKRNGKNRVTFSDVKKSI